MVSKAIQATLARLPMRKLNYPKSLAVDGVGNLYIADTSNSRIRRVSVADSGIITVAGNGTFAYSGDGGPAANAQVGQPYAVAPGW